jgi:hypothetical protein
MPTTSRFSCIVQPTQTVYDNAWKVDRTTTDGSGNGCVIQYECSLQYSQGGWFLYITMPGSRYPTTHDLKDGDVLHVVQHNVGTGEEDKGSVQVTTHPGGPPFWVTTYSYTADMIRTIP